MKIIVPTTWNPYHIPLPEGYGAFDPDQNQDPIPEEHCPKCGDLVEECECALYDRIEESEI